MKAAAIEAMQAELERLRALAAREPLTYIKALEGERDALRAHNANLVETAGETNALALAEVRRLTQREKSLLEYNTEQVEAIRHAREGFEASERLRRDLEKRHVQLLVQRQADAKALLTDGWLILHLPTRSWWRPNSMGYTGRVEEAGRYELAQALSESRKRSKLPDGRYEDEVVPSPEFAAFMARVMGGDLDPVQPMPPQPRGPHPDIVIVDDPPERDRCQFCRGTKGNVRGNENVYADVVACDDCSVLVDSILRVLSHAECSKNLNSLTSTVTAQAAELNKQRKLSAKLHGAILWALGERGHFQPEPERKPGETPRRYWWRHELRKRAGL